MDRDKIEHVVAPLFDAKRCVSRSELLDRIEHAPQVPAEDKEVLKSLWEDHCYTRDSFHEALEAYGMNSPAGYGSIHGGF